MKKFLLIFPALLMLTNLNAETQNQPEQIMSNSMQHIHMCVELGQIVKKGELLFYMDTETLKITKQKDINAVKYYGSVYNRDKKLIKTHIVSQAELDDARNDMINTIQDVKSVENDIMNSFYLAPYDGIVTKIVTYTGSGVTDAAEIMDLLKITPKTNVAAIQKEIRNSVQIAQIQPMTEGIIDLKVEPGQYVKKGQLIFSLNTVPKRNHATTYIGPQELKYKSALNYYKAGYERAKQLLKTHTVSHANFQLAKFNYTNALDDLKSFFIDKQNSHYYAPFDGIVSKVNNYTGSNVGDGDDIVEITAITSNTDITKLKEKIKALGKVAIVENINQGKLDLNVKLGQNVKKGDLLYSIDPSSFMVQKVKDENNVKLSKEIYDRKKKLYEDHVLPETELELAIFDYINFKADLETTKLNIKYSYSYAPFDGKVTAITNNSEKTLVDNQAPIVTISAPL